MKKKTRQKGWWWKVEQNRTDVPFAILIETQQTSNPTQSHHLFPIPTPLHTRPQIHKNYTRVFLLSPASILEKLWIG